MVWLLYIITLSVLAVTFYQDYKYRAVSWFLFPTMFTTFLMLNIYKTSWMEMMYHSIINFGFISLIFGVITVYFSLKYGKIVNITKQLIGWGDILFLICLGVLFSPMNFMLFFTCSLFIIVVFSLFYKLYSASEPQIPLAGLQAMFLIVLMVLNLVFPFFSLSNDSWMFYFLYA